MTSDGTDSGAAGASGLRIRGPLASETECLVDIALAAWEPVFASFHELLGDNILAALYPDWRIHKGNQIRSACDAEDEHTVVVGELDGAVAGFATYRLDTATGIGEISNNAVDPPFQGRGIATRMYRHVLGELRQRGMRFARVRTGDDPSHAPARGAYQAAGFEASLPWREYFMEL